MSGQKTVTSAGTEVALGTATIKGPLMVKALTTNTGLVFVGHNGDGTVSSSTGYPLAAGDQVILEFVNVLSEIMVDSAVNGEGVAWIKLQA
jgi:hypothetical protein